MLLVFFLTEKEKKFPRYRFAPKTLAGWSVFIGTGKDFRYAAIVLTFCVFLVLQ